ncbi:MAG: glycosyltransferase family 4 protein [Planctomycetes bacterium]|nr:glycosyltransferase family 4 protein [Planctomycetota bacterium]
MEIVLLGRKLDVRGTTIYTLNLATQLAALGHGVRLLCGGGRLVPEFERAGIPVVVFPGLGDSTDLFLTRKIARKIREKPASLLHVMGPAAASTGASVAKAVGMPYLVSVHSPLEESRLPTSVKYLRAILVASESVRESLVNETRVKKDLIRVVLPGVDVKRLKETPPFSSEGSPVIGILGPLENVRGLDTYLEAAKIILAAEPATQFLLIGEGPEEERLRKKTDELGIRKNVTFHPDLDNYYSVLAGVDIFMMPFQQVGLGNTVLEEMACGKPVVASSVGGVYYVIREDETGLLRPKNDPPAFAEAVLKLLHDRDKARRIGHAARLHVEKDFTAERMAAETVEVYQKVLEAAAANG